MNVDNEIAEVTQADREVAWPFRPEGNGYRASWDAGTYDHLPIVQTLARHRLAAEQATEARVSEETLEVARAAVAINEAVSATSALVAACGFDSVAAELLALAKKMEAPLATLSSQTKEDE